MILKRLQADVASKLPKVSGAIILLSSANFLFSGVIALLSGDNFRFSGVNALVPFQIVFP